MTGDVQGVRGVPPRGGFIRHEIVRPEDRRSAATSLRLLSRGRLLSESGELSGPERVLWRVVDGALVFEYAYLAGESGAPLPIAFEYENAEGLLMRGSVLLTSSGASEVDHYFGDRLVSPDTGSTLLEARLPEVGNFQRYHVIPIDHLGDPGFLAGSLQLRNSSEHGHAEWGTRAGPSMTMGCGYWFVINDRLVFARSGGGSDVDELIPLEYRYKVGGEIHRGVLSLKDAPV